MLGLLAKSRSGILPLHGGSNNQYRSLSRRGRMPRLRVTSPVTPRQYRHPPDLRQLQNCCRIGPGGKMRKMSRMLTGQLLTVRVGMGSIVGGLDLGIDPRCKRFVAAGLWPRLET
jgi:hypothetical protein